MHRPLSLLATLLFLAPAVSSQLTGLPRVSPKAAVLQTIGATEVRVDYHRPAARGRTLWGELVPYDQAWRAGANNTTTFRTSTEMKVEGQELKAGTYGLHIVPSKESWSVVFSHKTDGWGNHVPAQDALRVTVTPVEAPHTEWMRYGFRDFTNTSAIFSMHWGTTELPVRLEVDTPSIVVRKIEAQLVANGSTQNYLAAANFCLENDVAADKGLQWVERALADGESIPALVVKAGLLDTQGNTVDADVLVQRALELSPSNRELRSFGVVFQRRERHELALRFLYPFVDANPESAWAWEAIGDSMAALSMSDEARDAYAAALSFTQDASAIARIREASAKLAE